MNKICCIYNSGLHYRWAIFKALADNFDIDFCFGPDTAYTKSIKTFDYNQLPGFTRMLKNRRLFGKFYWQSGAVRQAFKPYRQYLMLGEAYCLSSWVILLLTKVMGKQTVCWTHGWYGRESGMKRRISKWFYSLFNQILTYNNYSRQLLIQGGISADKIRVIGNSLDSAKHREMRSGLSKTDIFTSHFGNSDPVLLYCGRIQQSKRLDLMITAATQLKQEGTPVNLVFVGKDSEDVGLDSLAAEAGITERVWMYGPCYDEGQLAELFYNSALCVSPGNVGLTAVHALSFGCPVVTHDNLPWQGPEFECIKPGVTGDFFRQNDADDLARVVKGWLHRTDAERSATAAAAFAEIDAHWNVESQIEIFKEVLINRI
ncbi:MAG: glycosyltransferase [Bacteroidaceae bacterium]|nr:glycosyltransferase [Bacteroidaceae bacterium]